MLCRLGSKNQITIPKELLQDLGGQEYFKIRRENLQIILEPVVIRPMENDDLTRIRNKIATKGIKEDDLPTLVAEAKSEYNS